MADQSIAIDENWDDNGQSDVYLASSEYFADSLASSIYEYRFENGRRYHAYKDGKYPFPNDETEQNRLDILHHIYLLLIDDRLHLAPITSNPQRILDIGTGTGIWAIDAGERYPNAEVIGTDLSPIQPSWVPPNVRFQIDDAESEWTWAKNSFDLIHIRNLTGAINDWPMLLKQAFDCLKPGGYIEIQEYDMYLFTDDGSLIENSYISQFYKLVNMASDGIGRSFKLARAFVPLLEERGFEDINKRLIKLPMGTWPADPRQKELGAYLLLTTDSAYEAIGMALLTRELGMETHRAKAVIDGARRDANDRKLHSYTQHYLYYARKPLQ